MIAMRRNVVDDPVVEAQVRKTGTHYIRSRVPLLVTGLKLDFSRNVGKAGPGNAVHGLALVAPFVFVLGCAFRNYKKGLGAALRIHASRGFVVNRCLFEDIGTPNRPSRWTGPPPKKTTEVVYSQCISGYGRDILIQNCRFRRFGTDWWKWSHGIYPSSFERMMITGCTFADGGNPITYKGKPGRHVTITQNRFRSSALIYRPGQTNPWDYSYVVAHGEGARCLFMDNDIAGDWRNIISGSNLREQVEDVGNDLKRLKLHDSYAVDRKRGDYRTRADWMRGITMEMKKRAG